MKLLTKIRGLKDEFPDILERVLKRYENQISELNKSQLAMGFKSDNSLMPPYSKRTISMRAKAGRPVKGERIALYDYGDFWKGIFTEVGGGLIKISSKDEKTQMLIREYSEDIFGLNDRSIKWLRERIIKDVRAELHTWLKS